MLAKSQSTVNKLLVAGLKLQAEVNAANELPLAELKQEFGSADAVPKWNCTANFVAEQLDRLRKMTDEEKWEFFKRFFEMKGGAE